MSKKGMALLNLKYNPFGPEVPASALSGSDQIDHFCWRIENLSHQGGFALITGQPGSGKSSVLRILHQKLQNAAEIRSPSCHGLRPRWPTFTESWEITSV